MSNYTEEEQIAQFKEWWSRNGKPLVIGGALAVLAEAPKQSERAVVCDLSTVAGSGFQPSWN